MKILDIVNDRTKYPDDAKFSIGGEEVTFAEFRKQNLESQGELARTIAERETKVVEKENLTTRAQATLANVLASLAVPCTKVFWNCFGDGDPAINCRAIIKHP